MRNGSNWLRVIAAVVAGYLASVASFALVVTAGWRGLGAELLFHPGTTLATSAWMALSLAAGLLGGCVGGLVAVKIRPGRGAVWGLATALFVVGSTMAIAHGLVDDPTGTEAVAGRRVEELSAFEASSEAVAPVWFHALLAVAQAGGVLLAGRFIRSRSEPR